MREPVSLRVSLTRRLAVGLFGVALAGTFAAYQLGSRFGNKAYDRALADDVMTLAEQITINDGTMQVDLPSEAVKWLLADEGEVVFYRVTDLATGKVVKAQGERGVPLLSVAAGSRPEFRNTQVNGRRMRISFMQYSVEPTHAAALIEIGETMGKREQMTDSILLGALSFMVVISLLAIGLVWYGVGRALEPLRRLEAEAKARSGADLAPLDPMNAPEEVRGMIVAINSMMARVSAAMQSQSHFIANAAHQLRTPLAGLRLQAQLGLKAADAVAMRTSLAEVESSAVRASDLVEKLLVLAKAESADDTIDSKPVNFEDIARQVVDRFLRLADQRCVDLGIASSGGDFRVAGSAFLFSELLGNLVDNAIVHGRHGGQVTIELDAHDDQVLVTVVDDGPGFANPDTAQLFTRFYRQDSSSDNGNGGNGLGLAIVREIVERYHGRISLASKPGNGSRLALQFPIWREDAPGH